MAVTIDLTNYNALVQDDGSNTVGSVFDKVDIADVILTPVQNAITALETAPVIQTTTSTGSVNDFALTASCKVLRCNNASLLTFTGFAAGYSGQRVLIVSVGAGQVDLVVQSASSTAANRLLSGIAAGTISLAAAKGTMEIEYDATTARWRVVMHNQGAPISVPWTSTDFTATSGTFTVQVGDLIAFRYVLDAVRCVLSVNITIATASVSATPNALSVLTPGGFSCPSTYETTFYYNDNGTAGVGLARANGTTIIFIKPATVAWQAATNTTEVRAAIEFEVS